MPKADINWNDWNAVKNLARKVARKAGHPIALRGESSTSHRQRIHKGDPIRISKEDARLAWFADYDRAPEDEIWTLVAALRDVGIGVLWDGNVHHSLLIIAPE